MRARTGLILLIILLTTLLVGMLWLSSLGNSPQPQTQPQIQPQPQSGVFSKNLPILTKWSSVADYANVQYYNVTSDGTTDILWIKILYVNASTVKGECFEIDVYYNKTLIGTESLTLVGFESAHFYTVEQIGYYINSTTVELDSWSCAYNSTYEFLPLSQLQNLSVVGTFD
jgi:hypothetical protein